MLRALREPTAPHVAAPVDSVLLPVPEDPASPPTPPATPSSFAVHTVAGAKGSATVRVSGAHVVASSTALQDAATFRPHMQLSLSVCAQHIAGDVDGDLLATDVRDALVPALAAGGDGAAARVTVTVVSAPGGADAAFGTCSKRRTVQGTARPIQP